MLDWHVFHQVLIDGRPRPIGGDRFLWNLLNLLIMLHLIVCTMDLRCLSIVRRRRFVVPTSVRVLVCVGVPVVHTAFEEVVRFANVGTLEKTCSGYSGWAILKSVICLILKIYQLDIL
jgi:hypothetical protein